MTTVSAPTTALQMWRVVVIDDSPDDRAEVRRLLLRGSERRYALAEAETGAAGVRAVLDADDPPDCVVLDYNLPDMDAVEVLAALAGPDGLTTCPVVVLTGTVGHEQTRAVLRAGAQDYLGKGWMTPESLTRAVENAAERWAMARELRERDAALRETNQQLQMSLSVGRACTFTWDISSNEVRRLPSIASHLDATTGKPDTFDEIVAKVHPDDRDSFKRRVRQAIERPGREYSNEYRVLGPDGSVRWLSDTGRAEFSDDGKPLRLVGMATDITDRNQAEEALQGSERRLRLALEAGATGLWDWDVVSNVVTWSPECYAIHGMKEGEFDGTAAGFDRLLNPDDRSRVWATVRAAVEGRTRYECEFRIVRPDGEVRWVANTGRAEYDQQGRPLGVIGTITDITVRKKAEAALWESEERLGLALSGGKMGMWDWDMRSGQSVWNAMEYELLGLKEGDSSPSAELFFRHVHPEDLAPLRRSLDEVRPERPDWNYDCRIFRADGALRWVAAVGRTQYDADGRPERMFGVNFDITEHKESEAALRESEARLGGILRRSPAGIVQTDATGCMTLVNPRWCEMLGYSEAELLGRSIIEVTHPSFVDETRTAVGSLAAGGPDFQIEKAYCRKDGSTLHAQSNVAAIRSPTGEFLGLISVVLDISERLRIEEVSRRLAEELSEVDRRKDDFLATLAHELRNPLAPIRNGLQIMKLPHVDAGTVEKSRSMMERQVEQMTRLIDDLMDVSRINRGKIQLQKTRMSLADAVRNAVDTSRPLIDVQGHELFVDMPAEPVYLEGDLIRLSQVFANLLNNSAKYTDPGGRIRLSVERQGNDAVVSVSDNGVGIPPDMLANVFDMFAQIDGSLERTQGGLGIGLNIVKRLVEMHGGTITAESGGPGLGSTFTVRLPLALSLPDEISCDPSTDEQDSPTSRRRILVADDNRDGAFTLAMVLKLMGNNTQTAHDGLEAVAASEAFKPDVILMDIGMPKLNGYDACRRIREQPWADGVVIVALTGWGREEDRQKSKDAGFNGHLVKPVDHAALMKLLANL